MSAKNKKRIKPRTSAEKTLPEPIVYKKSPDEYVVFINNKTTYYDFDSEESDPEQKKIYSNSKITTYYDFDSEESDPEQKTPCSSWGFYYDYDSEPEDPP
jgi:hypothetical protein